MITNVVKMWRNWNPRPVCQNVKWCNHYGKEYQDS